MKDSTSTRSWIAKLIIICSVVLLALLGISYAAMRICFPAVIMSSASMVVFHWPLDRKVIFLDRVVGVPGDTLRIRDKKLYRNGVEVTEPYAQHISTSIDSYRDNFPSVPNFPVRAPVLDSSKIT